MTWPGGHNLQTSQINNPGLAVAPAVTNLTAVTDTISDTRNALGLTATTTNSPTTVALYRDGTAIGTLSSSGGANWTGNWGIGPVTTTTGAQPADAETVDGSYQLSAKAFDQYGQYGATRSQTIVVNRRRHFAPARVAAGRNGNGADRWVEIEWSPAKEHDSKGFRVYRRESVVVLGLLTPGTWTEVCALAVRTACRDAAAPAPLPTQTLEYSVVGFDRDPAGDPAVVLREGDRSAVAAIANPAPAAPGMPGSVQATLDAGNVVLTWTAPAGITAPDHYNIYRDGQAYADRLDSAYITPGQPLTYTDTRASGQAHDYWITAVNGQLGESAKLGPVRR